MGNKNNNNTNFRMLTWKCEGISTKISELLHYMQREKIDIAFIGETKITENKKKLYTPGFTCHRNDRKGVLRALLVLSTN